MQSLAPERTDEGRGKWNGCGNVAKWNQKNFSNLGLDLDSQISEVAGMCDGEEDTTECVVRWMFELLSLNILINDMANKKWQSLYMEVLQSSGTIIHLFVWNIGLIQICILLL